MNCMNEGTKITPSSEFPSILLRGIPFRFKTPVVMGIINLTSDSFYSSSRAAKTDELLRLADRHIREGAQFLDLGAASTRPGASLSASRDELEVLLPGIEAIQKHFPEIYISVDTYHSEVAKATIEAGADILNDVSGGRFDARMFETIARYKVPYVLMHSIETPATMQNAPEYDNVLADVLAYLKERIDLLHHLGVADLIIDPGFGFGKNPEHNFRLMAGLDNLHLLNCPVLVGVSRKSMITRTLQVPVSEALTGTTALHMYALTKGAHLLRVHDVKEAVETVRLFEQLRENS